ncbi:ABC transporter permease [Aestuariibius sp. 2305UL40-4]|uniref:ABC transporter permease n=1 Tax=Aestuariibius violaceus TaxID=3234132 RepID=UPI00345ED1CE
MRSPANLICLSLVGLVALAAILAPLITPHDPAFISVADRLQPPSLDGEYLLGSDHLGRDVASRLLFGARVSMGVGAAVVALSCSLGVILGLLGGYLGRAGDLLMRIVDGMLAFPEIVLALALIAALGSSLLNVILALTFVFVPRVARVVHASVLSLRNREFVLSAEALGCSPIRVVIWHILPQALGLVAVQATFIFAHAVISEAGLTFLGVGLPPGGASWGAMLSEGRAHLLDAPWITTLPGLAIFSLVLSLNILGDGLRDMLDPRLVVLPPGRYGRRLRGGQNGDARASSASSR